MGSVVGNDNAGGVNSYSEEQLLYDSRTQKRHVFI